MGGMATTERRAGARTHEVTNQAPPLAGYNVYKADRVLREAVRREGADWAERRISEVGEFAGSERAIELGRLANENPPKLARTTATATGWTSPSSTPPGTS